MSGPTGIDNRLLLSFVTGSVLFSGSISRDQHHDDQEGERGTADQK
jgi:hypothetical protein